jgi:hypothetical protein
LWGFHSRRIHHQSDFERGLVPLVIGVTGHRDLPSGEKDLDKLREAVQLALDEIRKHLPTTPFLLLTSLAEGADRFVAEVATSRKYGARILAPLPFEIEEYDKEFRELKEKIERWWLMPSVSETESGGALDPAVRRKLQYAAAGAYVARYSQILIALWDGEPPVKIGGTAQVVRFRLEGCFTWPADPDVDWGRTRPEDLAQALEELPEPYGIRRSLLDPPESRPVYHIITPRKNGPRTAEAYEGNWQAPSNYESNPELRERYIEKTWHIYTRIETLNREGRKLLCGNPDAIKSGWTRQTPSSDLPPTLHRLWSACRLAAATSHKFQRRTFCTIRWLFFLVYAAAVSFAFYAHLLLDNWSWNGLAGYLSLILIAVCCYLVAKSGEFQNKFQDYRAVAEGLRVLFYWRLAGMSHSASDYYLRKQKNELEWIRDCIRTYSARSIPLEAAQYDTVRNEWIQVQLNYYKRAERHEGNQYRKCAGIGHGFVFTSLAMSCYKLGWRYPWARSIYALGALAFVWLVCIWVRQKTQEESERPWKGMLCTVGWFVSGTVMGLAVFPIPRLGGLSLPASTWYTGYPVVWVSIRHLADPLVKHLKPSDDNWFIVALGLTALAGAFFHLYSERRAFREHDRRYHRMLELFSEANRNISDTIKKNNTNRIGDLIMELGKEALTENGDWVILHRERPIQLPKVEIG